MPYIELGERKRVDDFMPPYHVFAEEPIGVINYVITKILLGYLGPKYNRHYSDYNEAIGVLECAKQELYRKLISEYEDRKCQETKDVY